MLKSKTVFILGAGASHEVGFPLGAQLKNTISTKLEFKFGSNPSKFTGNGDGRIFQILRTKFNDYHEYFKACKQIKEGIILSPSIDNFIDIHKHDQKIAICGKLAIACSILEAEKQSKLYYSNNNANDSIDFSKLNDVWYTKFYNLVTTKVAKENLEELFNNITVINFNYDRSLEHFLIHALSKNYIIGLEKAKCIVDNLAIFRPYGSIDSSVEFGSVDLPDHLDIVTKLKTYTEQVEDQLGLKQVHQAIDDSQLIVILGMAYHQNNMDLLRISTNKTVKNIYATRFGISDSDLPILRRRISKMLTQDNAVERISRRINFSGKCSDLFDEYQISLSEH